MNAASQVIVGIGGAPLTAAEKQDQGDKLLSKLDRNNDGSMDFDEFSEWFKTTCASIQRYRRMQAAREKTKKKTQEKQQRVVRRGPPFDHWRATYLCPDRPKLLRKVDAGLISKLTAKHGGATAHFWGEIERYAFQILGMREIRSFGWSLHSSQDLPEMLSLDSKTIEWRVAQSFDIGEHCWFVPTRTQCNEEFSAKHAWAGRLRKCVGVWCADVPGVVLLLDSFGRWTMRKLEQNYLYPEKHLEITDWKPEKGTMVPSDQPEAWRTAGATKVGRGFELVQDQPEQLGHLLCRVPFHCEQNHIWINLDYRLGPKTFEDSGGIGLCIYLVDPTVPGWDQEFDGTGPLGFIGKAGALFGVALDMTGDFSGIPGSVSMKRASDARVLSEPVRPEDGICTDGEWRNIRVKYNIEKHEVDFTIDGQKIMNDVPFDLGTHPDGSKVEIPRTVCVGVCAATDSTRSNLICVNHLRLQAEI